MGFRTWPEVATAVVGSGDVVYAPTTSDIAINDLSDVTIVTRDVTGVAVGDQLIVDAWLTILNDSGANRAYIATLDFDGLFDIEFTTAALATSATARHPWRFQAVLDVRSTSLAYSIVLADGTTSSGMVSGTDPTIGTTQYAAKSWATSASDASGTATVALKIRAAASASATQTCRLHHFTIRKVTPT